MRSVSRQLLVATLLVALFAIPSAAQTLKAEPLTFNLGTMGQREIRDLQVIVTNEGSGGLVISDLEADCGCTVPELGAERLAPGESTNLDIKFDSKLFVGPVIKTIRIISNDPRQKITEVVISATITAPLVLEPSRRRVGFPDAPVGQVQERAVTFMASTVDELVIEVKGTAKGLFQVNTVNNLDGDPRRAKLEVRTLPTMEWGLNRDNVRVTTNVPEMPTVDIEIAARAVPVIDVLPMSLNLRFKKKFSERIRLNARDEGRTFAVTSAETDLPNCIVTVDERTTGREIIVHLKGRPVAADHPLAVETGGRVKGHVTIHTDAEDFPLIQVPVTYMVRM
ncbi:MAG: DUF1573 domain-containing protein [bacterium]|nr:DUF1573 domain-containing protein [bacterium]